MLTVVWKFSLLTATKGIYVPRQGDVEITARFFVFLKLDAKVVNGDVAPLILKSKRKCRRVFGFIFRTQCVCGKTSKCADTLRMSWKISLWNFSFLIRFI
jgi:hypothetical protein